MRLIRLFAAVLLASVAACGSMQDSASTGSTSSGSLLIDEPVSPYPYNSRFW